MEFINYKTIIISRILKNQERIFEFHEKLSKQLLQMKKLCPEQEVEIKESIENLLNKIETLKKDISKMKEEYHHLTK